MLVSPAWLKSHLADRQLVLLQIGERGEFDKEHIPGARFLDFESLQPIRKADSTSSCRRWPNWIRPSPHWA